jgi:hypothetical protein
MDQKLVKKKSDHFFDHLGRTDFVDPPEVNFPYWEAKKMGSNCFFWEAKNLIFLDVIFFHCFGKPFFYLIFSS